MGNRIACCVKDSSDDRDFGSETPSPRGHSPYHQSPMMGSPSMGKIDEEGEGDEGDDVYDEAADVSDDDGDGDVSDGDGDGDGKSGTYGSLGSVYEKLHAFDDALSRPFGETRSTKPTQTHPTAQPTRTWRSKRPQLRVYIPA